MNPLKSLADHGQAVWLDFLSRGFIAKGGLKKLADDDGLRGVTSNPSIFEQAIGHSDEYDAAIARMLQAQDRSVGEIFEHLAVEDIQQATDVLRPTFDATHGADGYVSIEVSPYLAKDTQGTIDEAKRLWREVGRKNLMIKVPGTQEGPAGDPRSDRRRHQRQHHAVVRASRLRAGGRSLSVRPGGAGRQGRRHFADRQRGEFFRQPHRHRGRQIARREDRAGQRSGRESAPQRAQGQDRRRQCQARLSALQAAVRRRALAGAGREGRENAAAAVGFDRHQEQGL